jgi:hypothetical protein
MHSTGSLPASRSRSLKTATAAPLPGPPSTCSGCAASTFPRRACWPHAPRSTTLRWKPAGYYMRESPPPCPAPPSGGTSSAASRSRRTRRTRSPSRLARLAPRVFQTPWAGDGRVRVSMHLYNDRSDLGRFFAALDSIHEAPVNHRRVAAPGVPATRES